MKNILKITVLLLAISFTFSCAKSEAPIDELYDGVDTESGAIVRVLSDVPELISVTNAANNQFDFEFNIQQGNGSVAPDFKEVRFYVRFFADQDVTIPITTDSGAEIPETLYATFTPDMFQLDNFGLPRTLTTITGESLVATLPADANVPAPAFTTLRIELEMNNGDVFTDVNAAVTLSGIFFSSPFIYRFIFLNA